MVTFSKDGVFAARCGHRGGRRGATLRASETGRSHAGSGGRERDQNMKQAGIPVVVGFSGRPMITEALGQCDVFVAACFRDGRTGRDRCALR
jgi:hypothetical protein